MLCADPTEFQLSTLGFRCLFNEGICLETLLQVVRRSEYRGMGVKRVPLNSYLI